MKKSKFSNPSFPSLIQDFFCDRLINQQNASVRTIAAYRDTFCLLLRFIKEDKKKSPTEISLADLDATCILSFLEHLEKERKNTIRTRNVRFAAIRSFLKYASLRDPLAISTIQQVLAIPMKRYEKPLLDYLSREEMQAILDAPPISTWSGKRDQVMLATLYNTGARVSEIIGIKVGDLTLKTTSASVKIEGKGRKRRTIPLWKNTAKRLNEWLKHIDHHHESPLFPNALRRQLSRSGVENRLKEAVQNASKYCPALKGKKITPHIFRHTTAMHLLQSGVDISVIALWLGHESTSTTHMYVQADLKMKELALSKTIEPSSKKLRYKAEDKLLQFLNSL